MQAGSYDIPFFFEKVYRERNDFGGSALHDPSTIAWLLMPDLFETRLMRVDVETNNGLSFGRTVLDIWNIPELGCHTNVALNANSEGFFELLNSLLSKRKYSFSTVWFEAYLGQSSIVFATGR